MKYLCNMNVMFKEGAVRPEKCELFADSPSQAGKLAKETLTKKYEGNNMTGIRQVSITEILPALGTLGEREA